MKKYLAALVAVLAMLIVPSAAQAWHVNAQCVATPTTITATAQWYGFSYGHDRTHLEIFRVIRSSDQWKKVAQKDGGLPASLTYPVPLNDEFTGQIATTYRTYVAKAWFDVAEGGASKSPDCVVPPPVKGCDGKYYPPNTPLPVCRPECDGSIVTIPPGTTPPPVKVCPPPPVTPPQPPVPPIPPVVVPPTPPNPPVVRKRPCVGRYKIVTRKTTGHVKFGLRGPNRKFMKAEWYKDDRYMTTGKRWKVSKRFLYGKHTIRARAANRCRASVSMTVKRPPRRYQPPPRFAG